MHAIVESFNSDITSDNHINENMFYLVQSHTEMNAHLYVACFESKHALLLQMKKYILDKLKFSPWRYCGIHYGSCTKCYSRGY